MKHLALILTLSLVIISCATTKQTYTPSGSKGYAIDCSGTLLNWNLCYKEAGDICQSKGYKTLDKQEAHSSMYNPYYGYNMPIVNRTLVIECNK